ncbi:MULTISPECIES: tripartite tricarboxylate transporter substrate binding protein [unclassified Achromobacter]|uniref:Bug family tripartite tricarboxylate transporter substrate binding protein n=1 Tax=unclassified Achromobacter TaxID=2626865 RepID=UPI000B518297|nr:MULTISPECIES: tripartite tricarboxylate transporter substrate binding protein [unclassified Achromobacter]OWT80180.1 ABC transporter substrate-binding protein [Achromobacter sp. HZ34]OWT82063.1 ABC transporter substrate-binding protein [Achromobacter sp. HZ28]
MKTATGILSKKAIAPLLITLGLALPAVALAQGSYIRLVVAFPPGGPSDIMARVISERLGKALHDNVVVENRPGGNGAIAAQHVLQQPADGKTLWLTTSGAITINPSLYPKLAYDVKDFAPVSLVVNTPEMLVVNPKNQASDAKSFIENAKKTQVNFASSGIGSMPHMAIALLTEATKVSFLHVPEKGAAPAISDLMGGHVDAFLADIPGIAAQVRSGTLKGLAVAAGRRSTIFPNIPTFAEQGIPGLDVNNWSAVYVSAKVSPEKIAELNRALRETLADPQIDAKLRELGVEPQANNGKEMAGIAAADAAKWQRLIKANNIQPE